MSGVIALILAAHFGFLGPIILIGLALFIILMLGVLFFMAVAVFQMLLVWSTRPLVNAVIRADDWIQANISQNRWRRFITTAVFAVGPALGIGISMCIANSH